MTKKLLLLLVLITVLTQTEIETYRQFIHEQRQSDKKREYKYYKTLKKDNPDVKIDNRQSGKR